MAQRKAVDFPRFRIRQLKAVFRPRERRHAIPLRRLIDGVCRDDGTFPAVFLFCRCNQLIMCSAGYDDTGIFGIRAAVISQNGVIRRIQHEGQHVAEQFARGRGIHHQRHHQW